MNDDYNFAININDENIVVEDVWKNIEDFNNDIWTDCYNWIVNDSGTVGNYSSRRSIVRNHIAKNGADAWENYVDSYSADQRDVLVGAFDAVQNLIIINKTDTYFEIQKALKKEYIDIYTKTSEISDSMFKSTLGTIVSFLVGIYTIIFQDGEFVPFGSIYATVLYAFFSGITLFVIILSHLRLNDFIKYKKEMKSIYEQKFLFGELDKDFFSRNK